jgi:hypothetical protein
MVPRSVAFTTIKSGGGPALELQPHSPRAKSRASQTPTKRSTPCLRRRPRFLADACKDSWMECDDFIAILYRSVWRCAGPFATVSIENALGHPNGPTASFLSRTLLTSKSGIRQQCISLTAYGPETLVLYRKRAGRGPRPAPVIPPARFRYSTNVFRSKSGLNGGKGCHHRLWVNTSRQGGSQSAEGVIQLPNGPGDGARTYSRRSALAVFSTLAASRR